MYFCCFLYCRVCSIYHSSSAVNFHCKLTGMLRVCVLFQHMVQNQLPPTYQYAQTPGLEEYQPVMVQTPVSSLPAEFKSDQSVFTSTAITTAVTANGGVEQQTVRTRANLNVRWVFFVISPHGFAVEATNGDSMLSYNYFQQHVTFL